MILLNELNEPNGRKCLMGTVRRVLDGRVIPALADGTVGGRTLAFGITVVDVVLGTDSVLVANDHAFVGQEPSATDLTAWRDEVVHGLSRAAFGAVGGKYRVGEPDGTAVVYVDPDAKVGIAVACAGLGKLWDTFFANLFANELMGSVIGFAAYLEAADQPLAEAHAA